MTIDSANFQIVGVLKDYFYSSFQYGIAPAVLKAEPDSVLKTITLLAQEGEMLTLRDELEQTWNELYSGVPFPSHFQSDVREAKFADM